MLKGGGLDYVCATGNGPTIVSIKRFWANTPQASLLETNQVLISLVGGESGFVDHLTRVGSTQNEWIEVRSLEGALLFVAAQNQRMNIELLDQPLDIFPPLSLRVVERGCSKKRSGCAQVRGLGLEQESLSMELVFGEAHYFKNKNCFDRNVYDGLYQFTKDSEGISMSFAALRRLE